MWKTLTIETLRGLIIIAIIAGTAYALAYVCSPIYHVRPL